MTTLEYDLDGGGNKWYSTEPIQHGTEGEADLWWQCPVCEEPLDYSPTHDVSIDGLMLTAVPDVWRCESCGYNHAS